MEQESELGRLEVFVARLLDRFNALQAEKKRVDDLLKQREATIAALEGEVASLKDERGVISGRVSGLLGRIEEWEASVNQRSEEDQNVGGNPEGAVVQGSLF